MQQCDRNYVVVIWIYSNKQLLCKKESFYCRRQLLYNQPLIILLNRDTRIYSRHCSFLPKKSSYIFSKFNPLIIWTPDTFLCLESHNCHSKELKTILMIDLADLRLLELWVRRNISINLNYVAWENSLS